MQVAILAGGQATRLRPLTEETPKSMVEIQGRPFLEYQLELLRRNSIQDIVLCIGYRGEQIESYFGNGKRFGVNIRYSYEREQLLGTAGALKNAGSLLEDIFFTMYGDSYLFLDFAEVMSYFKSENKLGLMTVYKNCDRYDRSNTVVEGNLVTKFSQKEKAKDMVYIEYGANIFKKEVLNYIPEKQPYSLNEVFLGLIDKRGLLAYEVKERFYQIGSPQGLEEFKEYTSQSRVKQ